jgi:hypothetical protein
LAASAEEGAESDEGGLAYDRRRRGREDSSRRVGEET